MTGTTTPSDPRRPIRTCVGCRSRRPQDELHRCVLDADGAARISRTAPGRGAWICGAGCLDAARRNRGFQRAWRTDVPPDTFDRLRTELSEPNN